MSGKPDIRLPRLNTPGISRFFNLITVPAAVPIGVVAFCAVAAVIEDRRERRVLEEAAAAKKQ